MAIEFARIKIHSRSRGESSVAAAAYRAGIKLYDERTGVTHDYSDRTDVVHSEIMLPDGAGARFTDRERLWNDVEFSEKRQDSQVSKELIIALPKEFSLTDQKELARRFVHYHYVQHGLGADINIHDNGNGNPHAHVLLTTRRIEGNRLSKYKARDLNPKFAKGLIIEKDLINKSWRAFQNEFAVENGYDVRVDLNHTVPEKHEGRIRKGEHYTKEHNEDVKELREHIALHEIDNFINLVSLKNSVFTRRDIEKLLFKSILNHESHDFSAIVKRVMQHKDVVELGIGPDGKTHFTTKQHYVAEARVFASIEKLEKNTAHQISGNFSRELSSFGLREEQLEAINHITQTGAISSVVGLPGAGKSYMLKALQELYQSRDYQVIGAAISDKVTKALKAESGMNAYTLSSLNYRLDKGYLKLNDRSVVVIDEAGMVDFAHFSSVIESVRQAGSKLVLVGDPNQLKPVGKGDLFRGIIERIGCYLMEDIKRQKDELDRQASRNLCKGDVESALSHYENKGGLVWSKLKDESIQQAAHNWVVDVKNGQIDKSIMLAFTRKSVEELNQFARLELVKRGVLSSEKSENFQVIRGERNLHKDEMSKLEERLIPGSQDSDSRLVNIELSLGDRLIFSRKDKGIGIDNGDVGTIVSLDKKGFSVKLDTGTEVKIPALKYQHYDYAYAVTVHKSQGMTVDNAHVVIDSKYWDKYLSLVAMTRHREKLKVYASHSLHKTRELLVRTLLRAPIKDNLIDWPLNYALRLGFTPDSLIGRTINRIADVASSVRDKWSYVMNYEDYLKRQEWAVSKENKAKLRNVARDCSKYLDEQSQISNLFTEVKENHGGLEHAPEDIKDRAYYLGLKRDKLANSILEKHGESVFDTGISHFNKETIKNAADRYARYLAVKNSCLAFDKGVAPNIDEINKITLKKDYPHIKKISETYAHKTTEFYLYIEKAQKPMRLERYKSLQKEYPELRRYDKLVQLEKKSIGKTRRDTQNEIASVCKSIDKNAELKKQLKEHIPKLWKTIDNRLGHSKDKGHDR